MGTDIHIYFEKHTDNGWVPYPHAPTLNPEGWWENIVEDETELEKALISFGLENPKNNEETYYKLLKFCKDLSLEEAERLYGSNKLVLRSWPYPYSMRQRDYGFFAKLSGVRYWDGENNSVQPLPLGVPDDCCIEIRYEVERYGDDGHTHSWIMADELINNRYLINFNNVQEIRKYLWGEDLSKIRMVFWYDN